MQLPQISPAWYAASIGALVFVVVFPLALGLALRRRLNVGWRYFWFGALIFLIFQIVTRVPAVEVLQSALAPELKSSKALLWAWLFVLALSAGLFEEVGRYVGYRWFMGKEEKTWRKAVMYGAGHGGLESMLLVGGASLISLINVWLIPSLNLGALPEATRQQIGNQFAALAAQPVWFPLLGAYERVGAIAFHIAMSVVVLQVFRRGQIRWLWLAVLAHFLFDFATVAVGQLLPIVGVSGTVAIALAQEGVVTVGAALGLWVTFALRDRPASASAQDAIVQAASGGPASE